ncbi:MAG: helix-turn-helix domain-containing protein [Candidatus Eisenbacteria bacterium]|uniref:Helix-turn-helix domain-containing protein n=1 Tax=Eiseniibacteriota bacterium TaxID=2212470 RepID=A0A933SDP1_UNCEI|nr:helix-turn-helix domain-containing protein [Candidatus Eisenbacteria bacterium]
MNDRQRRIQELLLVLADRSRFHMLCVLSSGPQHVSELGRAVGLSQSCATRHVQALTGAGAVECRRHGKRVMVQVRSEDEVVRTLLDWMAAAPAQGAGEPAVARPGGSHAPTRRALSESPDTAARKPQRKERTPVPAPDSGTPAPAQVEQVSSGKSAPVTHRALEDFLL